MGDSSADDVILGGQHIRATLYTGNYLCLTILFYLGRFE